MCLNEISDTMTIVKMIDVFLQISWWISNSELDIEQTKNS